MTWLKAFKASTPQAARRLPTEPKRAELRGFRAKGVPPRTWNTMRREGPALGGVLPVFRHGTELVG